MSSFLKPHINISSFCDMVCGIFNQSGFIPVFASMNSIHMPEFMRHTSIPVAFRKNLGTFALSRWDCFTKEQKIHRRGLLLIEINYWFSSHVALAAPFSRLLEAIISVSTWLLKGSLSVCIELSSQVKLLITNNAFCIVQRATAQSKTRIFRECGVLKLLRGFKPAGLTV
jgi:hypothetical protein